MPCAPSLCNTTTSALYHRILCLQVHPAAATHFHDSESLKDFSQMQSKSVRSLLLHTFMGTTSGPWTSPLQDAGKPPGPSAEEVPEDGYSPAVGDVLTEDQLKQGTEKFNADISSMMKEKGDLFDEMVVHEEQIRLGEDGWKARYYQVSLSLATPTCILLISGPKHSLRKQAGKAYTLRKEQGECNHTWCAGQDWLAPWGAAGCRRWHGQVLCGGFVLGPPLLLRW